MLNRLTAAQVVSPNNKLGANSLKAPLRLVLVKKVFLQASRMDRPNDFNKPC
jgi:hypothetical protein